MKRLRKLEEIGLLGVFIAVIMTGVVVLLSVGYIIWLGISSPHPKVEPRNITGDWYRLGCTGSLEECTMRVGGDFIAIGGNDPRPVVIDKESRREFVIKPRDGEGEHLKITLPKWNQVEVQSGVNTVKYGRVLWW